MHDLGLLTNDNDTEQCLQKDKQETLKLSTAADEVGCDSLPICSQCDKDSDFFQFSRKNYGLYLSNLSLSHH